MSIHYRALINSFYLSGLRALTILGTNRKFLMRPLHIESDIQSQLCDCCFNHIVGLPRKDNVNGHLNTTSRVKKATGLGVTQNLYKLYHCNLRIMPWAKSEGSCIISQLQGTAVTVVLLVLLL